MSCACTTCGENLTLDPWKRVFYTQGLVLGVDEFMQEELRFLEGERRQNRALHGYGTVCGLEVQVRDSGSGPEVHVAPGLAIDPRGRWMRVPEARCALLNAWLQRNPEAAGSPSDGSPSSTLTLALRLCYRECETDHVPIPGGPCRVAEESMSPSRITESFALDLTLDRPDQAELEAVRRFARLLGRLRVVPGGTADIGVDELEALGRAPAPTASPPGSPEPSPGSPGEQFDVPEAEIVEYLHAAFLVWVTEVRPALLPPGWGCAEGAPDEGCILLATLSFPTTAGGTGPVVDGDAAAVDVDPSGRPILLHTQLLQELMLAGAATGAGGGAQVHGDLLGLDEDDHGQYLLVTDRSGGGVEDVLLRNLSGGGSFRISGLPEAAASGDAMPHGQTAGGDLSGSYPDPVVRGLQGLAVPQPTPADAGRALRVTGTSAANLRWELAPMQEGGHSGEEGLVRIFALSWRHNRPHDFRFDLDGNVVFGLAIAFGREMEGDASIRIGMGEDASEPTIANALRLYSEFPHSDFNEPGVFRRVRLMPQEILPIQPVITPGAQLFSAGNSTEEDEASAVLLLFKREPLSSFSVVIGPPPVLLFEVEVLGDHIVEADERSRAIDAEFVRGELPTGDRPGGAARGIQGGRFVSWFRFGHREDGPIEFDFATVTDLVKRAGISERMAMNVVNARNASLEGLLSFDDLRAAPGVSRAAAQRIVDSGAFTFGRQR
jgi:hypothetical protein